ncbi:phage virion morphogenesis protein [Ancylobacter pratisalsi]|uniref:Phage virion morphogenesis protein n=1 Tax=Ancylobacter pratisalsi TaxID=1745854 RepID=A0A6P1YPY5_9HYPH|nr:phage virion morphogenesis protein [Ancylobacter pratisalsi]QIB34756.1 phage virion morphogenesis protein [Ancylobacter pratisalsi]
MAGVTLETTVAGSEAARRAFAQLARVVSNTTPIMAAIGTGLVENVHQRFENEVDPDGQPWAPLNPAYASIKRGPGILRESGMRGGLMGSITRRASHDSVEIGTNKIYASVHQFGAVIRPVNAPKLRFMLSTGLASADEVEIPARPFLGFSREDQLTVLETLADALDRAVGLGR